MSAPPGGANLERMITPRGPLRGKIRVPGDKSVSHRALLLNALGQGEARVHGLLRGDDVLCTLAAVRALGVSVDDHGDSLTIHGAGGLTEPEGVIDCGNAGTAMRVLCGVVAADPIFTVLTGDASLRSRPMGRVARPLRKMGARIDGRSSGDRAPLAIRGGELEPTRHDLAVASAQVKTALLLAGRHVGVSLREPRLSRDHTERMLRGMGADLSLDAQGWIHLRPGPTLRCVDVVVPGDVSSAAFWLVAASILPGSHVELVGVGVNPTRTGVIDALQAMGADIEVRPRAAAGPEPLADITVRAAKLHACRIDGDLALRALDELPVLAVAAAFAEGQTTIADAAELRVKESDRISAVAGGLRTLGVSVEETPDGLVVTGGVGEATGHIDARGDHRLAMAFAVAGLAAAGGVRVSGAHSVATSYPGFWDVLGEITG